MLDATRSPQEGEVWCALEGWSGAYSVSSHGRVWTYRKKTRRCHIGRELRGYREKSTGYRVVALTDDDGVMQNVRVHVLVAAAFRGPRPKGQVVRHLNDQPNDNRVENLLYGTVADNAWDKVRNGGHHGSKRTQCPRGHRLQGSNLCPNQLARGRRSCLACKQALNRIAQQRKRGHVGDDLQRVSDEIFTRLMTTGHIR